MADLNRVVLTGNLTRDPEKVENSKGLDIAKFSLAVNRRGKDAGADFFNVTVFNQQAVNVLAYLEKGRKVSVDGRLQLDQWEKDGQKRSAVRIIGDSVNFLSGTGEGGSKSTSNNDDNDDIPF